MRGNNRRAIFADDLDREQFLIALGQAKLRHHWRIHAYCLMGNHYHLMVETPEPNIGLGMRWLNSVYSHRYNQRHGRIGHLFQRRYGDSVLLEDDHVREVVRYIPLNPVRARLCKQAEDYRWSSYAATLGLARRPRFLTVRRTLDLFDPDLSTARERLHEWVADGRMTPREKPQQTPLDDLMKPGREASADDIREAHRQGYSFSEIARHLRVSHTTVRRKMATAS